MEKRLCSDSGIALSVLGIGCWSFGGGGDDYWGPQDERDAADAVSAALDDGITYFDTAEMYNDGRSEESLGRALRGQRQKAIIGSKVSPANTAPAVLREHCEASLRRLGVDAIDIYMVHWPITDHSVEDAFSTLMALRDEGKVRAIGVSNHGVRQLTEAVSTGAPIVVNQLCYNLLSRAIEAEILPLCRQRNIGVIGYMPLQQGLLTGKYRSAEEVPWIRMRTRHFQGTRRGARHGEPGAEAEIFAALDGMRDLAAELHIPMGQLALAWALARPGITCVLAGARTAAQVADNAAAARLALSPEVISQLDALTDPVLNKLGSNADYWESSDNSRIR
jgi:aryl-alcohol dehydrogenase-like predicted oxidoreductase